MLYLLNCLGILLTAFTTCTLLMLGIQIFFRRRARKIEALMQGMFGELVTVEFIENAFRRWWVPVDKLLAGELWKIK